MFEAILWASWRSNADVKAIFTSTLTQFLEIWSQNHFLPPGSLEDGDVPEKRILPQLLKKAILSNILKIKIAQNNKLSD